MYDSMQNGFVFLVSTLFDLFLFVLIVRLILMWSGVNYFDPVTQFVTKVTNFLIKPLRRVIPNFGKLETSTLVVILCLQIIKFLLVSLISYGMPNAGGLALLACADTLKLIIQFFFYAILIQVIMTWIQPQSPIMSTLYQVTSPIMQPIQRLIPPVGGMDISPIPAMLGLQLLIIMLINPLMGMAVGIAFGG
jgi:YggT family protein